jgi:2-deoxy-D-gluconate 3-dehydrogenase
MHPGTDNKADDPQMSRSDRSVEAASASLHELFDLTGRVSIITGGSRGIGKAIAVRLHEAGADVVIAGRDLPTARRVTDWLNTLRADSALPVRADVSDESAVDDMVSAAADHFGGIDILVNNAGIFPTARVVDIEPATIRASIDVNLVGTMLCTRAVARRMIEQNRGGVIINVTSIAGMHRAQVGLAHYDAAKHGQWGFTRTAALELAEHRIRVNALAPGPIKSDGSGFGDLEVSDDIKRAAEEMSKRIPMGRFGEADEIGRIAVFLASDMSSFMTGAQVAADGGVLLF